MCATDIITLLGFSEKDTKRNILLIGAMIVSTLRDERVGHNEFVIIMQFNFVFDEIQT